MSLTVYQGDFGWWRGSCLFSRCRMGLTWNLSFGSWKRRGILSRGREAVVFMGLAQFPLVRNVDWCGDFVAKENM